MPQLRNDFTWHDALYSYIIDYDIKINTSMMEHELHILEQQKVNK
jgi:hypothetical protein